MSKYGKLGARGSRHRCPETAWGLLLASALVCRVPPLAAAGETAFVVQLGREVVPNGIRAGADLNGDGRIDIVTRSGDVPNVLTVALTGPDGQAMTPVRYPSPQTSPWNLALADADGDGDVDLVTGTLLYLNDGDGVFGDGDFDFAETVNLVDAVIAPSRARGDLGTVFLVDLSGDGLPDLVFLDDDSGHVFVQRNLGDRAFAVSDVYRAGPGVEELAAADFDGDEAMDFAVGGRDVPLLVFRNLGDGLFAEPLEYASPSPLRALEAADLDGDGDADLLLRGFSPDVEGNGPLWLRGRDDGTFDELARLPLVGGDANSFRALGDFDGDGKADLLVSTLSTGLFPPARLWLQRDDGRFVAEPGLIEAENLASSPVVGDFDGDGDLDVSFGRTRLNVLVNTRIGPLELVTPIFERLPTDVTFASRFRVLSQIALGRAMTTADLDRDGSPEVLIADNSSGVLTVVEPARSLESPPRTERQLTTVRLTSVAVADVDGDGNLDVGVASRDNLLVMMLGRGDGSLGVERSFPTGPQPLLVEAHDLDGDGLADWILPNASDSLTVYWGTGTEDLVERADVHVGGLQFDIAVEDFTADGLQDIAVTWQERLHLLANLGNRAFSAPVWVLPRELDGTQLGVGDLDADGRPDLVVGNARSGPVEDFSVLLGRDGGRFANVQRFDCCQFVAGSSVLPLRDLDGDGVLDLAFVSENVGGGTTAALNLLSGIGNGRFQSARRFPVDLRANPTPYDLAAADFDRDGDIDLAAGGSGRLLFLVNETPARRAFRRGDSDANGVLDMSDAVSLLNFLFAGATAPPCRKAADSNDDGEVTIGDPVRILTFLFSDGRSLSSPFVACGQDPSADLLTCREFAPCE